MVGLTAPHSWQAQSSHLCRPTSVILTVSKATKLDPAALQPPRYNLVYPILQCFWHSQLDFKTEWKQQLVLLIAFVILMILAIFL